MVIKVAELFAGVGGFRVGLEGFPIESRNNYKVVWSNQWEPSTKKQHANLVYENIWGVDSHCGDDIASVDSKNIPEHDLLVGGFPCQDYSVATTLKRSGGLIGKKGVLWWQIHRILVEKGTKLPKYLMLENVDRLIKSPASQRGRDFAVILSSLNSLGYAVEWKVINAADYGMPQRRRRVFIQAYHKSTAIYQRLFKLKDKSEWLTGVGPVSKAFPGDVVSKSIHMQDLHQDLSFVSKQFNKGKKTSPFENTGLMIEGRFYTFKMKSSYKGRKVVLGEILIPLEEVSSNFFLSDDSLARWNYLKGSKKEKRYNKAGEFWYNYAEGSMVFPDAIDNASRTIITGEGGNSPSRFKHVVMQENRLRRLMPVELERLNMFPDNHTRLDGISDTKRAFFMGNALVVGVVKKLGSELMKAIHST